MSADTQHSRRALNDFFISVQIKALRQTEFAVKNKDEALDILQDAMEKLARKYANKPDDWGPLFQRILQNTIRDWYRKQKVKQFFTRLTEFDSDGQEVYPEPSLLVKETPEHIVIENGEIQSVKLALAQLPLRQQQAFILRAWWGNSVAETAFAMQCSQGSVKTHYSRATSRLKQLVASKVEGG